MAASDGLFVINSPFIRRSLGDPNAILHDTNIGNAAELAGGLRKFTN